MRERNEGSGNTGARSKRRLRLWLGSGALLSVLAGLSFALFASPAALSRAELDARYAEPLPPPSGPLRVFHLGHSLVGRDMPAMLAELAGNGHRYESALGWGATLKGHWGDAPVAGAARENAHPRFRDAGEAADSGDYDAFVLTEMVEIRDAIRYYQSPVYLRRWADRVAAARPDTQIFLYETWHQIDDPDGWLNRLDRDLPRYWEGSLLAQGLIGENAPEVYVIPAGQVFARFIREVQARGGVEGITGPADLFAINADGEQDVIHPNDLGAYLVALTHYAVLYQKSPVGLPRQLHRADGSLAAAPGPEAARLMQETVWEVVSHYPKTGVPQQAPVMETSDG